MLQDFSFKILHRPGLKHGNADALSKNPVGQATDDDDFSEEIRDVGTVQTNATESAGTVFSALYGKTFDWLGFRRHASKQMEHHECCFGINHWHGAKDHQLFMLHVVTGTSQDEENHSPVEDVEGANSEENQNSGPLSDKQGLKKERFRYYDRQHQLELALPVQELSESDVFKFSSIESNDEEDHEMGTRCIDIWEDAIYLGMLKEGILPDAVNPEESKRARKRAINYCWKEQRLYFKGLYVPKPEERMPLVIQMHEDLGHFGEQRMLTEICRRYF
jgi:hypothetical protein